MTTPAPYPMPKPPLPPRKRARGKMAVVKHTYPPEVWRFLRTVAQIARRIDA